MTAVDVAQLFWKHVAYHHGIPSSIVSDRDVRFQSKFLERVMGDNWYEITDEHSLSSTDLQDG